MTGRVPAVAGPLCGVALAVLLAAGCAAPDATGPPGAAGPVAGPVAPTAPLPPSAVPAPGLASPERPGRAAAAGAAPLGLTVPSLGIATGPLLPLDIDPAGALEVPPDADGTGWFVHSPQPGDPGPAIVAAHVDYGGVPGVFARLGDLRPGDPVTVRRSDGAEVAFTVYRVDRYPKSDFPSDAVYGNTPGAELRLITCGGAFDALTGHYRDNVVAYARRV